MELSLDLLQPKERASFGLRALYEAAGCRKYHMGQFEEYALYQENQSFLPSRQVITFTDLDGRLLALKPDVTLSIAKSAQPAPGETKRFYYSENVYRPAAESHTFKEIAQMGVEFIGRAGEAETGQAVALAARSLAWLSESMGPAWRLEVGHMGYLSGLMEALAVRALARQEILARLRARNSHGLRAAALAAALYNSRPLDEVPAALPGGVCLVIGSEGQGLTEATIAACDRTVRIPMTGRVESLNAGIAGSILLWHFRGAGL